MGSFTFSEMATIAVIVLIVFGPKRLPELARRAGSMLARFREATREIRDELTGEYAEVVAPLKDLRDELKETRTELTSEYQDAVAPLKDLRDDLKETSTELTSTAKSLEKDLRAATDESAEAGKPHSPRGPVPLVRLEDMRDELSRVRAGGPVPLVPLEDMRDELSQARAGLASGESGHEDGVVSGESGHEDGSDEDADQGDAPSERTDS